MDDDKKQASIEALINNTPLSWYMNPDENEIQ